MSIDNELVEMTYVLTPVTIMDRNVDELVNQRPPCNR